MEELAKQEFVPGEVQSRHRSDTRTGYSYEEVVVWDGERWIAMMSPDYHRLMMKLISDANPHQHKV